MPDILVNGKPMNAVPDKITNVVAIKNPDWKTGDLDEKMFFNIPIPEGADDAELASTHHGYLVSYTYKETRKASLIIDSMQERICTRRLFFDKDFKQVAEHIRFTEWKDAMADRSAIAEHGLILPRGTTRPS